jgi:glycosyltransferase involved in cell wall biosynthesis
MVSVLIPSRNEKYLEQTIKNVLDNARGDIEILVALDGWLPEPQIVTNDPRVTFYHEPTSIGQRQSINKLARLSKGEFIMKLDAHCAVDEGFDVKLVKDCEYDWTVIPRMYNLDVQTWAPKLHKRTDYMLMVMDRGFLRANYYPNLKLRQPRNNVMIAWGHFFSCTRKDFGNWVAVTKITVLGERRALKFPVKRGFQVDHLK